MYLLYTDSADAMSLVKKMMVYFLLVILVASAGFVYTIYKCADAAEIVGKLKGYEVPRLEKTADLAYNAMAQSANVRAYLLYGNEQYLNEYRHFAAMNVKLEEEMLKDSSTEEARRLVAEIKELDDLYIRIIDNKVVPLMKAGQKEEAMQVVVSEAAPVAGKLLAKVDEAKAYRKNVIDQFTGQAMKTVALTEVVAATAAFLAAVIGLIIAFFAARSITKPVKELQRLMSEAGKGNLRVKAIVKGRDEIGKLCEAFNIMIASQLEIVKAVRDGSVELAAASEELSASSEEISAASANIAEEIQDVALAMEEAVKSSTETSQVLIELSSLIQIAKDRATSAKGKSDATQNAAQGGKETVAEAMRSMDTIYAKTAETQKVIGNLNDYSQQIEMINETITGIAKQTNLLALNAAIEAARAGEAGRGFAVVAEEVRQLAEQSNIEAGSISQLINKIMENNNKAVASMGESLREVDAGVKAVRKVEESLEDILGAISDTVDDIVSIAKVTDDEVASSDKIVELIEVVAEDIEKTERDAQAVSAGVEETTATIETIAASSEQTSAMAQNLQNLISRFTI